MFKLATAATFQSPMLPRAVVVAVVGLVTVVQGPTADLMLASVMGRRCQWATAVGEKTSSGRAGRLGNAEMAGSEARRRHGRGPGTTGAESRCHNHSIE